MTSAIDPTVIVDGAQVAKSALREQLGIARDEITALQAITSAFPSVDSLVAFKALVTRPTIVYMTGRVTPNDGAQGLFRWYLADVTAADDATVITPTSGVAGRYKRMHNGIGELGWWGARGSGSDEAAAINLALASGFKKVIAYPGANYVHNSTITIPSSVELDGLLHLPGNPKVGTRFTAAAAVNPCVQVGSGGDNGTSALRNITISRTGGSPTNTFVGIKVLEQYNTQLQNVCSDNHGIGWHFKSTPSPSGLGLGIHLSQCHTTRYSGTGAWNEGYAEVYWNGGRFGQNGSGDYAGSHTRFTGGATATAGGPNTVKFIGVQFNSGSTASSYLAEFINLAAPYPGIGATIFLFMGCHIENVATAIITSDASWNIIDNLAMDHCFINCPATPMFTLNAGTAIYNWEFNNTEFFVSTWNIASTAQIDGLKINGGYVSGTMSLNPGGSASTVSINNLGHGANFTIAGVMGAFHESGQYWTAGAFINNATGSIYLSSVQTATGLWTPALKFGVPPGASVGMTYSLQTGRWQINGRMITCSGSIILTAKGASVGIATISGLPLQPVSVTLNIPYAVNMAGLTGVAMLSPAQASNYIAGFQSAATGLGTIGDANFTNTSTLFFEVTYPWW